MKVSKIMLILLILLALCLVACGGGSKKKPAGPTKAYEPEWYGKPGDAVHVFAYGNATFQSRAAAESSARSRALAEAAMQVEVHVQTMTKDFISEAGINNPEVLSMVEQVTKTVANQTFSGAFRSNHQTVVLPDGSHQAFVQWAIPKEQINRDLVDRVSREQALYTRFRASQAFEELEKSVSGN